MSTHQQPRSTVATSATESTQTRAEIYYYFFRRTLAAEHRFLETNRFSDQVESVTVYTSDDDEPHFKVEVSDRLAKHDLQRFLSKEDISHYVYLSVAD